MTPLFVKICSNMLQHFASDVSPDLCIEPASFQDLSGVDQHSVSLTIKIVCFYSWRSSSLNKIGCSTKKAMTRSALNRYAFFSPSTNKKNVFWVSKNHIQWGKSPRFFTNAYGQARGGWPIPPPLAVSLIVKYPFSLWTTSLTKKKRGQFLVVFQRVGLLFFHLFWTLVLPPALGNQVKQVFHNSLHLPSAHAAVSVSVKNPEEKKSTILWFMSTNIH